jgi:hypothetical protein
MNIKPCVFAATLAIVLCVGSAPAEAQFYSGGSSISIGGPGGFFSVSNGPVIGAPMLPYSYGYGTPLNQVIVQPAPLVRPLPYQVYRPGWGLNPYGGVYGRPYGGVYGRPYGGVYGRPYGGVYGRPYGVYGRRGWW